MQSHFSLQILAFHVIFASRLALFIISHWKMDDRSGATIVHSVWHVSISALWMPFSMVDLLKGSGNTGVYITLQNRVFRCCHLTWVLWVYVGRVFYYWCPVKVYKHIKVSLNHCIYAVETTYSNSKPYVWYLLGYPAEGWCGVIGRSLHSLEDVSGIIVNFVEIAWARQFLDNKDPLRSAPFHYSPLVPLSRATVLF